MVPILTEAQFLVLIKILQQQKLTPFEDIQMRTTLFVHITDLYYSSYPPKKVIKKRKVIKKKGGELL